MQVDARGLRLPTVGGALALGLLAILVGPGWLRAQDPETTPKPLPLQSAWRKARVNGKYAMLMRQIKVSQDFARWGEFQDAGLKQVNEYAGFKDLPKGYWVYVYPYWYIWRDHTAQARAKRPWGPEQATGEPDTPGAGDLQTAWASLTPDGQDEWLLLEYAEPVVPSAVLVHETFCPGALYRVTAFRLDGEEVEVWRGKDPTPAGSPRGVSEVNLKPRFKTNRIKIHLNSKEVPGYNEIDAVGLRDTSGKMHWATAATASTSYAEQAHQAMPVGMVVIPAQPRNNAQEQRIERLETELKELKETVKELNETIKKLKK